MGTPLVRAADPGQIMKKNIAAAVFLAFIATLAAHAQNLESVLNSMDKAAADFRTAQTEFVWDQYEKVVDEHDLQKGTMYFRRQGDDVQMAADITVAGQEVRAVQRGHGQRVRAQGRAGHGIQCRQEQGRLRDLSGAGVWRTRSRPGQVVRREIRRNGTGAGHQRREAGI